MAYETEAEREARQQAERLAEAVAHKAHLDFPSLEKSSLFSDPLPVTKFTSPEIPASPSTQNIVDALVSLGFVTQAAA